MFGCNVTGILKNHGVGAGLYISVNCTAKGCGAKCVDDPERKVRYSTKLRDLKTVYESLTHCVGHEAYRSITEAYDIQAIGQNSFNDIKQFVYKDYRAFSKSLRETRIMIS